MSPQRLRIRMHSLVLALCCALFLATHGVASQGISAKTPMTVTRANPLAAALLDGQQAEAVGLIHSGIALDLLIERSLVDAKLPSRVQMIAYGEGALPGYPLAIAAAVLGMPRVLEAIGERAPQQLHATDSDNSTALNYAARQGYAKSVEVLLRYGLNPLQSPRDAWASGTPLSLAVTSGHAEVVKLLLGAIPVAQYGSDRVMEQVWAATFPQLQDHPEVLHTLLSAGISPNYIAPQGGTALINAIENQNPAQVRLLIQHGATAFSHHYRGRTAHGWAAYYAETGTPHAKDIAALMRSVPEQPSDWHKSKDTEAFERTMRMISNPGAPAP